MTAPTPDPQQVREIAREHAAFILREFPVIDAGYVGGRIIDALGDPETWHDQPTYDEWCSAVVAEIRTMVPSWPDEQPQAERVQPRLFTDIDRDANPYLRVRAFINAARQKPDTNGQGIASVIDNDGVMHMLTEDDVEGLLDDVGEMQEEIDRLIGELVKAEGQQAERDADVRAVAALLAARADGASMAECKHAFDELRARFAERIAALAALALAALDARKGGEAS